MKKKLLALLLTLAIALALAAPAFAADGDFTIENGVLTKYNGDGGAVVIPDGVTSIGRDAFRACNSLTSVTIPDSVTSIGADAFSGCSGLTSVRIPNSITSIADHTFYGCSGLTSMTIPNSVTSIGDYAFGFCSGLTSVTIPNSVTSIGSSVFGACSGLTSVTIPNSVTSIGLNAFSGCNGLTEIKVSDKNTIYSDIDGVLFNKKGEVLLTFPEGRQGYYCIPSGVTGIQSYAFSGCSGLTSVTIPDGVTSIGYYVFYACSGLTSVTIPDSVTSIGVWAFQFCMGLTDVYYSGSKSQWDAISVREGNELLLNATIHYSGTPSTPTFQISFDSNGGTEITESKTVSNGDTYGDLPTPVRDGYTFDGWFTAASGGTKITSSTTVNLSSDQTLYAHWTANAPKTYTVTFNANGGSVYPSSKTVTEKETYGNLPTPTRTGYTFDGWYTSSNGGSLVTSSTTVTQSQNHTLYAHWTSATHTVTFNANGGSVSTSSKTVTKGSTYGTLPTPTRNGYTFDGWYTSSSGGSLVTSSTTVTQSQDHTLYAHWKSTTYTVTFNANGGSIGTSSKAVTKGEPYGDLPTPTRNGYTFDGWYTSSSGGSLVTSSTTVTQTQNHTLYAHWTSAVDPYNLGDETYSFKNYGDSDSDGHCFGMSMTSAGYYNNLLDIGKIGGNANMPLYSFSGTQTVKQPICYYQGIQGSYREGATVAGGSGYLTYRNNIVSDWQEVVSYVRNHNYDGTGVLQIGFRKDGEGGHAINFLRYENVNGQDRIYAYDNNFPTQETYFYRDSSGYVRQAPVQTFSGAIDCIGLRDCRIYFNSVGDFDATHVLYMAKDAASVQGEYTWSYMETASSGEEYVMYEIPANVDRVVIIPNRDNATFVYMNEEYSFGKITDDTRGELRLASKNEGAVDTKASFQTYEGDSAISSRFTDIPANEWYSNAVYWAVEKGITVGTSATTFSPNQNCTEIQILTFLWRAAGKPAADVTLPFSVTGVDDYISAAKWAYSKGMINVTFKQDTPCTRATAVKFMWQAAGSPIASSNSGFTDVPASADYAQAVTWAVGKGVTNGTGNNTFSPDNICSRAHIVTFLYRSLAN